MAVSIPRSAYSRTWVPLYPMAIEQRPLVTRKLAIVKPLNVFYYKSALEVLFECKMLAEFDCKLDPINMIMLKDGIDFVYLTAKFTIDMKPPVD